MKTFIMVMVMLTLPATGLMAQLQEVSQWRGNDRSGVYEGEQILKKWPEGGPKLLWSYDTLGAGYSSVIVVGSTIYTTCRKDTVDYATALNLDGTLKWEQPYGSAWRRSFPDSRCTPTYENGKLYLSTGSGKVCCLNAETGKEIWGVDAIGKFEGKTGRWGVAESILIVDDKVVFTVGGEMTAVVAFDKLTGETAWQSESMNDEIAYVSPLLISWKGQEHIVAMTKHYVFGLNPTDGALLWKYDYSVLAESERGRPGINTNTPLFNDGKLFLTCGYNQQSAMLQIADDSRSVELLWSNDVLDSHIGGAVLVDGFIYGSNWESNRMGRWVCLDAETGETKYETEWHNKGPVIAADGMLICYAEKPGTIGLVPIDPDKFEVVSSFEVDKGSGQHWAHPVLCRGVLYVRHGSSLMAYNVKAE